MPAPETIDHFLDLLRHSALVDPERLELELQNLRTTEAWSSEPKKLAALLVAQGLLTYFQAQQLLQGKWRGFTVGKYKILERLGSGGMGIVYLCEHRLLNRRVAVKVLPVALAQETWFLERFYREAEAVAALDHPNIVHAHDIDQYGDLHFLVMEYVDGTSLQEIVDKQGPLSIARAAHYIRQAALGLHHAHEVGIVHRDIKPGNLLLDRQGTIKILDMGLAHFFQEKAAQEAAGKNQEKAIVGTGDYLAPEQVVNSDDVDIRADIYGLGATAYFLLAGRAPFEEAATDYHKLLQHLARSPRPLRELRGDLPEALAQVIAQMMHKNPWQRYQTPAAVVQALAPWTAKSIPPPPEAEMPRLSPAARAACNDRPPPKAKPLRRSGWSVVRVGESGKTAPTHSPSAAPPAPAAETQRTGDTAVKNVPPLMAEPTQGGQANNSSVSLASTEGSTGQSSLLRECLAAEADKPAAPKPDDPAAKS